MKAKTELKVLGARGLLPVEAAKREWVEELQTLVEDIPISICTVDIKGNVIYVSKGFEEIFGYPREEVLGKTGFELGIFPDEDLKHLAERTEARLKEKPSRRLEVQLKRKDGRGIWVEMEARVIKKSDVPVAFRLMSKDITDRKQAEETLRELKVKYQQIIDNTWDTIFHIELEGNFKFANKAAERLTGYPIDELLRMNMRDLIVPEYQSFVFGRLKKRIAGQPLPQPFDFEIVHKDAHRVVVELTTTGIHDRNGKLIGVQGIARNITERKRAEESLKESEERYRALFENSTEGVFTVDLAGNYTSVNKAMEELTGYSREELIGASYRDFVCPETAEFVFGEYSKLFRTGEPVHNIAYERISKDGKRGWLEGYANVIKKEGKVVGFQGTLRDITERKKVEQALRESEEKLRAQYKGIPVPTYTWQRIGEDLVLVDYNDAATAITQGHVASFVGKKDSEMYQDRPDILEDLSRCFAERTSIYREMLYEYMSTGETKHLAVSYAFVPPDLILVHTEDITERKRAEEEIHKVTQYLKSVIDNANVLLDVMDPEGNVLVWNKAAEVITGYSRDEVVGHNKVWKWLYPQKEYRRAIAAMLAAVMEGETVEDFECTIRTKRGEDRTLSWYSRNLLDEKGNPIGAVWLGTDITERKRLGERLKESEERYRALFENSIEAVFTVDIAGHFTSGNEALEELTGYPLEELIGASYKKIIVAEDVDHIFEEYNKLFGTGEPIHNLVYEMVRKDGGRRLIEGYVNLITEGARVVGFQGTLRDIRHRQDFRSRDDSHQVGQAN